MAQNVRVADASSRCVSIARRLEQAFIASNKMVIKGYALVSISVVIDEKGDPVIWTRPTISPLEPHSGSLLGSDGDHGY